MSAVKRYDWDVDHADDGPYRVESPTGEWVLASDYAAAEKRAEDNAHFALAMRDERDVLEAENKRLREALESIAANTCCGSCREASLVARAALKVSP